MLLYLERFELTTRIKTRRCCSWCCWPSGGAPVAPAPPGRPEPHGYPTRSRLRWGNLNILDGLSYMVKTRSDAENRDFEKKREKLSGLLKALWTL